MRRLVARVAALMGMLALLVGVFALWAHAASAHNSADPAGQSPALAPAASSNTSPRAGDKPPPVPAGPKGGPNQGYVPMTDQIIPGNPLQVTVRDSGAYSVLRSGVQQLFGQYAEGPYMWVNGVVWGPEQVPAGLPVNQYTRISNVLTGTGTNIDPWVVTTILNVGTTGIQLVQRAIYVNGNQYFQLNWSLCNTSATAYNNVHFFHAADLWTNNSDFGYGYFDPSNGAIGGTDQNRTLIQLFVPITPAVNYEESFYATIWQHIGSTTGPGPGFNNTYQPGAYIDNGIGLEWIFNLPASSCTSISDYHTFIPFTSTATPTVTGTRPTNTPTRTPTNTPTNTATATFTATPIPPATCGVLSQYQVTTSTGVAIVPGTTDTGNHCDDCTTTGLALPFPYQLYDQTFNTYTVSSNGNLQFLGNNASLANVCLPTNTLNFPIMGYWDDLMTNVQSGCSAFAGGCGIFTSVSGVAPNRIFNIEWRAVYFGNPAQVANFEIRLYEGQNRFDIVYGRVDQSGSSGTVGVQRDTGTTTLRTQYTCNTANLSQGLQLVFTQPPCGTPTPTPVVPTATSTNTATNTPPNTPTDTPTNTPTNTNTPVPTNTPGGPTNTPTPVPTVCVMNFTDVQPYNPFYIYIRCLYCRQIVSGYADNTFRPYASVTRAQVAKMVANAAGIFDPVTGQMFTDVPPTHPFYVYIERLAAHGYLNGYNDPGSCPSGIPCFRPETSVTRGQLAKIAANAAGFTDSPPASLETFPDVPYGHPFWVYIERLARRGIIDGYQCGTNDVNVCTGQVESCDALRRPYYRPCSPITRGQTAKILSNTFFAVACAPGPHAPQK